MATSQEQKLDAVEIILDPAGAVIAPDGISNIHPGPVGSPGDAHKPPEDTYCYICKVQLTDLDRYNGHLKSRKHKKEVLKSKNLQTQMSKSKVQAFRVAAVPVSPIDAYKLVLSELAVHRFTKEKYPLQHWVERPEQNKLFVTTLAAFLALRYSLNSQVVNMKISANNKSWDIFGDIVIELVMQDQEKQVQQVHAIQCKQVLSSKRLTSKVLATKEGKFSVETQYNAISKIKKCPYGSTSFILMTASDLRISQEDYVIELPGKIKDKIIKSTGHWSKTNKHEKVPSESVKIGVSKARREEMANTTDETDNIYQFVAQDEEVLFPKVYFFVNQKKTKSIRKLIDDMLEDKFEDMPDISHDLIRYLSECYKERQNYNYKLTKEDVLLKIAELYLTQNIAVPEVSLKSELVELWDCITRAFDLTITSRNEDVLNKIYGSIGGTLMSMFDQSVDISERFVKLKKENVRNSSFASQLFDGWHNNNIQSVSLKRLYIYLWKLGYAPLVLVADNERDQLKILKMITFIKSMGITRTFILLTSELKVNLDHFRNNLNIFTNLDDINKTNEDFLQVILDQTEIEVFGFPVKLSDVARSNVDFLEKTTSDTLLNMILGQCLYGNCADTSYADNTYEDVLILGDEYMMRIEAYLRSVQNEGLADRENTCCLTCQAAGGKPKLGDVHLPL